MPPRVMSNRTADVLSTMMGNTSCDVPAGESSESTSLVIWPLLGIVMGACFAFGAVIAMSIFLFKFGGVLKERISAAMGEWLAASIRSQ